MSKSFRLTSRTDFVTLPSYVALLLITKLASTFKVHEIELHSLSKFIPRLFIPLLCRSDELASGLLSSPISFVLDTLENERSILPLSKSSSSGYLSKVSAVTVVKPDTHFEASSLLILKNSYLFCEGESGMMPRDSNQ